MNTKWQKLCDTADWYDPEFETIIRDNLRTKPHLHRKQWEFAMIFRVLQETGMLNGNTEGIAFGAGKERLIYSVMEKVKKLTATDLYSTDAKWSGTKTDTPKEYLLSQAPFEVDPDRLDAKYMNMRDIKFPDDTFDFAYSSCVFEHISEDDAGFVEHLKEVHRTLKEGGVYVMTTEYVYGDETMRMPGSHFFELNHLLGIIEQSGLHVAPVFDARLTQISANEPAPLPDDVGFSFGKKWIPHVTCLRQSLVFTSCLLLLTKDSTKRPKPAEIIGYEDSKRFVQRALKMNLNSMWKNWQNVNVARGILDKPSIIGHESFVYDMPRSRKHLAFHTPFFQFGSGGIQAKISLIPENSKKIHIKLFSCSLYQGRNVRVEKQIKVKFDSSEGVVVELECDVQPDRIYAVLGRSGDVFKDINIKMRKHKF